MSILLNLLLSIIIIVACYGGYELWKYRRKMKFLRSVYIELLMSNEEMQRTMAMGLYNRFKKQDEGEEKGSSLFIRQDPYLFEGFVAKVMENFYGGTSFVTSKQ